MARLGADEETAATPEKAFGIALRQLRREKGLTQERLAFESGLHPTYISLLERGLKSPSLGAVFRLSNSLGVKPSELLARVETLLY